MLQKEQLLKLKTFDTLYWGCIRPLCIDMYISFCREVFLLQKHPLFYNELIHQYKLILKGKPYTVSRKIKNLFKRYVTNFICSQKNKYTALGFTFTLESDYFFFSYKKDVNCLFSVTTKTIKTTGLTELYGGNINAHLITFTNPLSEMYQSLLSLINRPLLYTFQDIVFEFDSIYLHERQHVFDDICSVNTLKTRSDEAYYRHLASDSTYHFNRYIQHPVEILANIQQLAYYLHNIKPRSTIDATRFLKFFLRCREYKYACSFKRTEVNKYRIFFTPIKSHDKQWYRLILRLINHKFFQLYRRNILTNIDVCINNLSELLSIK